MHLGLFKAEAYLEDSGGERLTASFPDTLKMLGFHFSERPTVAEHVGVMMRRFRSRYWILIHLKNAGFNEEELLKVYRVIIRPVHDYMSVVYHAMLTDDQDEKIERLQAHALKYIYGWRLPYARLREITGLPTLRARRIELCDRFAGKCLGTERFGSWFPIKAGTRASGRQGTVEKYREFFARCDRLKKSPLFFMRRRLNGKAGKEYGVRNRQYRD